MTLASASYTGAQSNTQLVAGQDGRIIRVVQLLLTTWVAVKLILISDPGVDPQAITPPLHAGVGQPLLLRLGRGLAIPVPRSKALGVTTAYEAAVGEHSVFIWYELVP